MPVSRDIVLPEDTETSYRTLRAADEQRNLRPLLRRLRIAALSEGRDVADVDVLLELTEETRLDAEQLRDDMDAVEIPEGADTIPRITGQIAGEPHRWSGRVNADRFQLRFTGEGVYSEPTIPGFGELAGRYEPVTIVEIRAAYEEVPTESDVITHVEFGGNEYWVSC